MKILASLSIHMLMKWQTQRRFQNVVNNQPQGTLPSCSEINPKSEGKENCEVTLSNDKELHEEVGGKLKRLHSDVEDDFEVRKKSMNGLDEKKDDGSKQDQKVTFKVVKVMEIPNVYKECFRVGLVKGAAKDKSDDDSYFLPMDEIKFGGDRQSSEDAVQLKEKTKRRREKTIFAIKPD